MPLDPNIILGGRAPQVQSPLETLSTVAQLQGLREQTEARRLAADKARQDAADQAAIRNVFAATNGDVDKALPELYKVSPRAAAVFEEQINKARKEGFDAHKSQLDLSSKQLDLGIKLLQGATDQQSYDLVLPMIGTMAPDIAKAMGPTYDPARVQQFMQVGLTQKDLYDRRKDALQLFTEGKANDAVGTYLSTARTAEEWNGFKAGAKAQGVPAQIVDAYGEYSPENVQLAATRAIGPKDRATLAETALRDAATQAHQKAEEAISRGQLAVAQGHLAVARQAEARLAQAKTTGTRELPAASATKIAAYNTGLDDLKTLSTTLAQPGATGIGATIGAAMPDWVTSATGWGTDAKQKDATIGLVKQIIGKTLEGGVLRKEDELKYAKILPKIEDSPAIVVSKLQGLDQAIRQQRQRDLEALGDAGYNVSRFVTPSPGTTTTAPAEGTKGVVNGVPAVWKTVNGKAGWYKQ